MSKMLNELVWVPDSTDGFALAEITDIMETELVAQKIGEKAQEEAQKYPLKKVLPGHRGQDMGDKSVADNTSLIYLHAAALLRNLRLRYEQNSIYTYTAHILIAVNPFKSMDLYNDDVIKQYMGKSIGLEPPHIYAIADYAYRHMKVNRMSQSIVVSGESGAGKTETSKFVMKYLTNLGDKTKALGKLEDVILEANPILESFGNAKTIRNKNSSRFGKFTEIHFDDASTLTGAMISHYLLEKSRVTHHNTGERNYHIFYEMLKGATAEQKTKMGLDATFAILGKNMEIEGVDDAKNFEKFTTALDKCGFEAVENESLLSVTAAVLQVSAIEMVETATGGAEVSETVAATKAAELLGVSFADLKANLTSKEITAGGSLIRKDLKMSESVNARDALAKGLYKNLFDWVVGRINRSLPFASSANFIGVLDIAGFEYFDNNSYEQFCINYCNEKLQGYFNDKVLRQEQIIYEKEGISVPPIEYHTNDDTIEMIELEKTGVFAILDEESKVPSAADTKFTGTLHEKFRKHPKFGGPRKAPLPSNRKLKDEEAFLIRHYAGAVCYQTAGFLDKNNDALSPDIELLMQTSSVKLVVECFTVEGRKPQKGKLNYVSVGSKFKSQLGLLMEKLTSTNAQFVRCVKPNMAQRPDQFDGVDILQQLHCGGMLEVLELMQKGFPSRTNFQDLYDMYAGFLPPQMQSFDPRTFCEALLFALDCDPDDFKFGVSKVFFRAGKYALLDEITKSGDEEMTRNIIAKVAGWLVKKRWKKYVFASVMSAKLAQKIDDREGARLSVQTLARAYLARTEWVEKIKSFKDARIAAEIAAALAAQKKAEEEAAAALAAVEALAKKLQEKIAAADEAQRIEEERKLAELKRKQAEEEERVRVEMEARKKEAARKEEERRKLEEKRAEEKRLEQLRKEQAELERQQRLEERARLEAEQQRLKEEEEAAAKREAEKQAEKEAERKKNEEAFRQKEEQERAERERIEQEQRDRALAERLAREQEEELESEPEPEPEPVKEADPDPDVPEEPAGPPDLSKWSYAQLRDTINSSTDIEMLQACRNEFQKRLKAYYNWKTKYENKSAAGAPSKNESASVNMNIVQQTDHKTVSKQKAAEKAAPAAAAPAAKEKDGEKKKKKKKKPSKDRYFRIPFTRPGKGKTKKRGLWWAHFEGQKIKRQLESHPHGKPICLVAGKNDSEMCDLTLAETGLTEKPGAEISKQTFEEEWDRCTTLINKDLRAKKIINILEDCGF